jgi:hypothetical protein
LLTPHAGLWDTRSAISKGLLPVSPLIFVVVILGATQKAAPAGFAGLGIGLTLVVKHIFGIHITGVGVNPARSLGPAIFAGGTALTQVWLFLVVPSIAGLGARLLFRLKLLEADEPMPEIRNRRGVENEIAVQLVRLVSAKTNGEIRLHRSPRLIFHRRRSELSGS